MASNATMQVELVSVERAIWSGEATAVYARTIEGEIGVLPGHAPLLGALAPGWLVRILQADGAEQRVAVHGGFLSVRADGVSVLAEMAEDAGEIDVARARSALERAGNGTDEESVDARNRALARLRAAGEQI
jgi:F-type H+-transporting ATPase subunit epsilon